MSDTGTDVIMISYNTSSSNLLWADCDVIKDVSSNLTTEDDGDPKKDNRYRYEYQVPGTWVCYQVHVQ